jgi:hypothetical protein
VDDFKKMVRDHNNVAWKNIKIVDVIPGGSGSFSFFMEGWQQTGLQGDLEVDCTSFPAGGTVLVRVIKRLADTATLNNMSVSSQSVLYTTFAHGGNLGSLTSMDFKPNERTKVTVYYTLPDTTPDGDYPIRCTLRISGAQQGQWTEVVRVSHFAFVGNRRTKEVHRRGCIWVRKMSPYNRLPFGDLGHAHRYKFDNCAYCLGGSMR